MFLVVSVKAALGPNLKTPSPSALAAPLRALEEIDIVRGPEQKGNREGTKGVSEGEGSPILRAKRATLLTVQRGQLRTVRGCEKFLPAVA